MQAMEGTLHTLRPMQLNETLLQPVLVLYCIVGNFEGENFHGPVRVTITQENFCRMIEPNISGYGTPKFLKPRNSWMFLLWKFFAIRYLRWGSERKIQWQKKTILATFCEEQNYLQWSFQGTKLVTTVSVMFVHTCSIECCTKTLVGLYLNLRGRSYQKQKLWSLCTGITTYWRLYCYYWAINLEKHQNEVASLELEHLRYWTKELLVTIDGWQKALSTGIA